MFALLILNLVVFDDLRIDPSAGVLETFLKPQHLSSIVAILTAAALVEVGTDPGPGWPWRSRGR